MTSSTDNEDIIKRDWTSDFLLNSRQSPSSERSLSNVNLDVLKESSILENLYSVPDESFQDKISKLGYMARN